jgi:hypothetical protein
MPRETSPDRYRREGETTLIELHLRSPDQLFDLRDPAPFRERDLDDDAVAYLLAAMEDVRRHRKIELRFLFAASVDASKITADELEASIRAHFRYERERERRKITTARRQGQLALVAALGLLTAALTAANRLEQYAATHTGWKVVREGLTIFGWVVLWNPVEALLFGWIPSAQRARLFGRIERAPYRFEWGVALPSTQTRSPRGPSSPADPGST